MASKAAAINGSLSAPPARGRADVKATSGRSSSRSPSPSKTTQVRTTLLSDEVTRIKALPTKQEYIERALKHGACTDSWHDFHESGSYNETDKPTKDSFGLYDTKVGIPGGADAPFPKSLKLETDPNSLHDENEIMQELFSGLKIGLADYDITKEAHPKFFMDTLVRKLAENLEGHPDAMDPTFISSSIDGGDNEYEIKLLHKKIPEGRNTISEPIFAVTSIPAMVAGDRLNTREIITFFGSNNINLLFDASVVDVLGIIRNCNKGPDNEKVVVNRLVNREIINDPAPKTYEFKKTKRPGAEGNNVEANILFDDEKEPISYSPYEGSPRELYRNKFYSKFNFNLSRLFIQKTKLPLIKLDITSEDGKVNYFDDDPHESNNIAYCWKRISQLFEKSPTPHIDAAVNFQCKRSGDWLQALSCFDTGRKYVNFTDGKKRLVPVPYKLEGDKIILVTHDRVLLYYAILMGLDVVMTYKISASKADRDALKKLGVVESEKGEDDDDGSIDTPYVSHPGKSTKYVIYFRNKKRLSAAAMASVSAPIRVRDPLVSLGELLVKAKGLADDASVATFIDTHNGAINEILKENEAEIIAINTAFGEALKKQTASKLTETSQQVSSLIQSYIKISCSNYKCIDKLNYTKLKDSIAVLHREGTAGLATNTLDKETKIKQFISLHDNLLAKSKKLGTKQQIQEAHANYKKNEHYKNLVVIGSFTRSAWGGRRGIDPSVNGRLVELGTYFLQNLGQNHLWNLIFDLETVMKGLENIDCGAKTLLTQIKNLCPEPAIVGLYNAAGALIGSRKKGPENRCSDDATNLTKLKGQLEPLLPPVITAEAGLATAEAKLTAAKSSEEAVVEPKSKAAEHKKVTAAEKEVTTAEKKLAEAIDAADKVQDKIMLLTGIPALVEDGDATGDKLKKIRERIEKSGVVPIVIKALQEENEIMTEVEKRKVIFGKATAVDSLEPDFSLLHVLANVAASAAPLPNLATQKAQIDSKIAAVDSVFGTANASFNGTLSEYLEPMTEDDLEIEKETEELQEDEWNYTRWRGGAGLAITPLKITEEEKLADKYVDIIQKALIINYKVENVNKWYRIAKFLYRFALDNAKRDPGDNYNRIYKKKTDLVNDISQAIKALENYNVEITDDLKTYMDANTLEVAATLTRAKEIGASLRKPIIAINSGVPATDTALSALVARDVLEPAQVAETASRPPASRAQPTLRETFLHTTLGRTLRLIGGAINTAFGGVAGGITTGIMSIMRPNRPERAPWNLEGGGPANNKISHALVLFYLHQLITDLSGFDGEGNEDYKYYQTLCCLVVAVCPKYNSKDPLFYNRLQAILFDIIPNNDLKVDGPSGEYIISHRGHAENVQFIGRQVALHTLGLATGEINSLGNSGQIKHSIKTAYVSIKENIRTLSYTDTKRLLIKSLRELIFTYDIPVMSETNNVPLAIKLGTNMRRLTENRMARAGLQMPTPNTTRKWVPLNQRMMTMRNIWARNNNRVGNFVVKPLPNNSVFMPTNGKVRGGRKTRKAVRKSGRKTKKANKK